jgi:hypothetical protein
MDLRSDEPLRFDELLLAGRREFLASPEAGGPAEKLYAYAWAVAYHLTFNEGLLRSEGLDRYVAPREAQAGPLVRFERLVGKPLDKFEPAWRAEMLKLRPR